MIKVHLKNGKILYLETPSLDLEKRLLLDRLVEKFSDKNTRAIFVVLDDNMLGEKYRAILCEDIDHIGM